MRSPPAVAGLAGLCAARRGSPQTRPGSAHRRTSRGWNGGAVRRRQLLDRGVLNRHGRRPEPGGDLVPGEGRGAGARRHREASGRKCSPNRRPTVCCRCQSPTTSRSSPGSRCTVIFTWKSPERCTRFRSICSARAWTPASTARPGPFLAFAPSLMSQGGDDQQNPSQVSETTMRVHRAHPEWSSAG
jgi:hypothetical protein